LNKQASESSSTPTQYIITKNKRGKESQIKRPDSTNYVLKRMREENNLSCTATQTPGRGDFFSARHSTLSQMLSGSEPVPGVRKPKVQLYFHLPLLQRKGILLRPDNQPKANC
jgi:hypothetical protein